MNTIIDTQEQIVLERALQMLLDNAQDELTTKRHVLGEENAVEDCVHLIKQIHSIKQKLSLQIR